MKLARLGPVNAERPVVLHEDRYFDLASITDDIDGAFLGGDGIGRVRAALTSGRLAELPGAGELRVGAPVARPGSVICVGMNFAAHAAETAASPPAVPIIFLKTPNTVVGPYDDVVIPPGSEKTDWEVELGVVIGRRATYLTSPSEAMNHIAGFVLANDLSERAFQMESPGGQWSKGKCCPGFNPTGPWLVTPEEIQHEKLGLRSWVNGEARQDSNTADMIFGVEYLVHHLTQYLVLDPGDLILTGTPAGVALSGRFPYLRPGDVVELEIDGLGRQRQRMVTFQARASSA